MLMGVVFASDLMSTHTYFWLSSRQPETFRSGSRAPTGEQPQKMVNLSLL